MNKFTLQKVFMCKDAPPDVKKRLSIEFNKLGMGSGNYTSWYCRPDSFDVLSDWLIANGAEPSERVIIYYGL